MKDQADRARRFRNRIGGFYLAFQLVLFGLPLVFLVATSLRRYSLGRPLGAPNVENYQRLFEEVEFSLSLLRAIGLGLVVSALSVILSTAAILGAWRFGSRQVGRVVLVMCAVMFFAGNIPRTFAFEFVLSANGPLGPLWRVLEIGRDGALLYSLPGIVLAYLPLMLPLCIIALFVSRESVSKNVTDAAQDLGAGWWHTQVSVVIPLMKPGLIVAALLSFILTVGDVVVVDLIGGSQVYTAPLYLIDLVKIDDWGTGAAAGVVLLIVVISAIGVASRTIVPKSHQ